MSNPESISHVQTLWVCVDSSNYPLATTVAFTQKDSFEKLRNGLQMSREEIKNHGWECVKAEVTFNYQIKTEQ